MSQHTFSKLILRDDVYCDAAVITDERGLRVVDVPLMAILIQYREKLNIDHWADDKRSYTEFTQEQQKANARRIVSCVNFCAGVSTENLETNEPLLWLAERYNTVKAQRDELLTALEGLLEYATHETSEEYQAIEAALAAVKAAKGGAS